MTDSVCIPPFLPLCYKTRAVFAAAASVDGGVLLTKGPDLPRECFGLSSAWCTGYVPAGANPMCTLSCVMRLRKCGSRSRSRQGARRKGGEEAAWERGCSDWPWLSQVWVCLFKRFASFKTISRYKSTLIEALHTPTTRTASTGSSAAARTPAHAPVSRHRPAQLHMDRARPLAVLVLNLKPVLQSPVLLQDGTLSARDGGGSRGRGAGHLVLRSVVELDDGRPDQIVLVFILPCKSDLSFGR